MYFLFKIIIQSFAFVNNSFFVNNLDYINDMNLKNLSYKLDVNGTLRSTANAHFDDDIHLGQYLYHSGDENTYMRMDADVIEFVTGGDTQLYFNESTTYLYYNGNKKFETTHFNLKTRKSIDDSCEVYLDNEFLGLIYLEKDDGETAYQFHMTIEILYNLDLCSLHLLLVNLSCFEKFSHCMEKLLYNIFYISSQNWLQVFKEKI